MKTRHSILFKVVRTLTSITFSFVAIAGCVTTHLADDVFIGDPAELEFRVIYSDLPNATVFWREEPGFIDSALVFNPPYTGCHDVSFYINPNNKKAKQVTQRLKKYTLIVLENESDELALWEYIPESDNCAVLLTIGTINDISFTGISASTRNGHFKRVSLRFPDPVPPDSSDWPGLIVAPIFDFVWTGMIIAKYPLYRPLCPSVSVPLVVSFQYPDGTHKETELTYDRAGNLYDMSSLYVRCGGNHLCSQTSCVAYWRNAAMLDLRMEFRDTNDKLVVDRDNINWKYRISLSSGSDVVSNRTNSITFHLTENVEN